MALMDAGVPMKKAVAGTAMGLIKHEGQVVVLTDIQGLEDFLGDMDFKVAGTKDGITAIQMDIKIKGIDKEILERALAQAKRGRLHILGKMNETIATHREHLSPYAPKIIQFTINPDKIREVIGSGGKTINKIIADTGVKIDIEDDGRVFISCLLYTSSLINYAREIKGVEIAIFVNELSGGRAKVSLRSNEYADVAEFAKRFGGGGHVHAAGYTDNGSVEEIRNRAVEYAAKLLK